MIAAVLKKFKKGYGKEENKELIQHSLLSLVARVLGGIASFAMNIVVARY